MNNRYILGIDTSNYKTSIAIIDRNHHIICDLRRFLKVKQGEKGLRQSDALFQHVKNLPELIEEAENYIHGNLDGIAYSSKPRPVEGSYMPVFLSGEAVSRSMGAVLDVPVLAFSHQEGHIEAIKHFSSFAEEKQVLACHFSGGTTELLDVVSSEKGYDIKIIGGSKDISYGQVLDRAGVFLGMDFPAGEALDDLALKSVTASSVLTDVKVNDGWLNLSGLDTQIKRVLENTNTSEAIGSVIKEAFIIIADSMVRMIIQGSEKSGVDKVLLAGGVSSSKFLKEILTVRLKDAGIEASFDNNGLSQDNAVGTALLGGNTIWH